jgi:hypothetical protein
VDKAVINLASEGNLRDWVRHGYLKRAWENDIRGKPVKGYEYLLKNLELTQAKTVLVHEMIDENRRRYQIFTDPKITELIGILRFSGEGLVDHREFRIEKLKELLANSFGSEENPWLSKLESERATFDIAEGHGILIESDRDIYSRRSRINDRLGKPVDGFDRFIKNLDKTRAQEVLVHEMVDDDKREYRIFTDPEIKELIGLLRFPSERPSKPFLGRVAS